MTALLKLLCRIGWHSIFVGYESIGFDGCSIHARCKWCGLVGLVDSQGGLFATARSAARKGET